MTAPHPTPPCCEAWPSWADFAAWYCDQDDPTYWLMPHLAGTPYRFNYCPSCGADRRSTTTTIAYLGSARNDEHSSQDQALPDAMPCVQ
jgi:hypothetical protein